MKRKLKWKFAQKMEFKWWQNYLHKKHKGEYIQYKKNYWQSLIDRLPKSIFSIQKQVILDAGCGPSGIYMVLDKHDITAIDPLLGQYKKLPVFNPTEYPWTKFIESPIELISEKKKYDTIFCLNAINHVNDINLCCQKLSDAIKDNGFLVMSVDAHRHSALKKIFQWLPGDILHPIQLNIQEYQQLLNDVDFEIIENILFKKENIFNYQILVAQKKSGKAIPTT